LGKRESTLVKCILLLLALWAAARDAVELVQEAAGAGLLAGLLSGLLAVLLLLLQPLLLCLGLALLLAAGLVGELVDEIHCEFGWVVGSGQDGVIGWCVGCWITWIHLKARLSKARWGQVDILEG
jgi:hypothetical protein